MNKFASTVVLLGGLTLTATIPAVPLNYADGDLAPLGAPDSIIDISDYLVATRIVAGEISATSLELSHGDLYPAAAPDGVINLQDLLLLQQKIDQGGSYFVENLDIFVDGPATVNGESGANSATTTLVVDGWTGSGTVVNDPDFTDPEDLYNTLWHFSVNNGSANVFLGTEELDAHSVLDTGFDLSGNGQGQLVFDIKVNSIAAGTTLLVKIDSGWPNVGEVALPQSALTIGSWQRVAIPFSDFLANPGPGGTGLDLSHVVNVFVLEVVNGSADIYLDNIFVSHACADIDGCNATIKTKPPSTDMDNDGVDDSLDQCPATPSATPVDATGCAIIATQLSATATASSAGAAGAAALAIDGNITSRWESAHGIDPSWITLDLGAGYALSQVIIVWEAANAASYQIQGSADNAAWTTLAGETGGAFGERTDSIDITGTYRYVRMYGLTRSSPYGYSIWEMEVYGSPAADEDGDGVDDSLDLCPGTPMDSTVDGDGCVFVDSDGDGVKDSLDQCPNTPINTAVDANGCTLIIPVNEVMSLNDILSGGAGSSQPGFSLYVFDNDLAAPDTSVCNGDCASNWPPLLVTDGVATGVTGLGTIIRSDNTVQATHNGRPLYYFVGDTVVGQTNGDGVGGVWHSVDYVQVLARLFDNTTVLEPDTQFETATALVTRFSDRPRTRHAREDQFQSYDHFIKFYFEDRSSNIEIVDYVAKGGDTIEMNVRTIFPLSDSEAENRWWYQGFTTVAQYASNGTMNYQGFDGTYYHYQKTSTVNTRLGRPIQLGDRMEFEISQFSAPGIPRGQANYYGTTFLYIVGEGIVPWYAKAAGSTFPEDSEKIPEEYWLGGHTSTHYQYSDEPNDHFLQMATNLGYDNGQTFLLGRRVHHSSFIDGMHDEDPDNGVLASHVGLAGERYINERCSDCHERNGGAPVAADGLSLDRWVFRVGDANGDPDPNLGRVLQPNGSGGEGDVSIASWTEIGNGLRRPNYQFSAGAPATFSARIAPRLIGLGLLEAIVESDIEALADPADSNGDGISGRMQLVTDAETGQTRLGRFGWKAGQPTIRQQVAAALNTDLGVRTSILPNPDCGSAQSNCGENSPLMPEENLNNLVVYLSTLGVRPQRVWKQGVEDQQVLQGQQRFRSIGCVACHTETFQTSEFHPLAEVRNQTIHPYSDMLLHDMGEGLADTLAEGMASGSEWRTTPLWGLGLAACVTGGVTNPTGREGGEVCTPHHAYLHDGRARSLTEAIQWHGGEADSARQNFEAMTQADKDALIAFLNSL